MSTGDRTAMDDLLARIEQADDDDEAARILAMDDASLDRELHAGGFDPAVVRAKGRAIGEAAHRVAKRARLAKGAKIAGLVGVGVAIAVAAALLAHRADPVPIVPDPAPSLGPRKPGPAPEQLRLEAMTACDAQKWQQCLDILDRAKAADPAGDASPAVQDARQRAARGLDEYDLMSKPK